MASDPHIVHERDANRLKCLYCSYSRSIPPWAVHRPDLFLEFKQEFELEHAECGEYAHNPYLARIIFKTKLALKLAELRKRNLRYRHPIPAA